jgi:hypothetical protein
MQGLSGSWAIPQSVLRQLEENEALRISLYRMG